VDVVDSQRAPYAASANITIGGPDVTLTPTVTQAVAMALHELVTNAVKYGALSSPSGYVAVNWHQPVDGEASRVEIEWRESGGPPRPPPAAHGRATTPGRGQTSPTSRAGVRLALACARGACAGGRPAAPRTSAG